MKVGFKMSDNNFMSANRDVLRHFGMVYAEQEELCDRSSVLKEISDSLKELVRIEKDRHYREVMQEIKEYEKKCKILQNKE